MPFSVDVCFKNNRLGQYLETNHVSMIGSILILNITTPGFQILSVKKNAIDLTVFGHSEMKFATDLINKSS